ncbi:MAG TPA: hypothetical protein VG759_20555 [Candidatus Angelobacter sp.]|jgi:hypothetical protein|nr:hypothetical protein [Candidatus Angelobacter sp.]
MPREIKDEDQSRQFNATMMIAIVVATVLALFMLGLVYGCMKANHAPELKPATRTGLIVNHGNFGNYGLH